MKAKNISWTLIKSVAILLLSAVIGLFLIVLAYALPVNPEKAESTFRYTDKMGWSPSVSRRYEQYTSHFETFEPDVLDDRTDQLILTYSLDDEEGDLFYKAAFMQGYGRYWQGYVVLLRPLLYFMDYWDFLLGNGLLQISLVFLLAFFVWRQTGQLRYCLAVLSSYLLLMPAALAFSLQFSPVFYLAYGGSIAAVCGKDHLCRKDHLCLFFLTLGILTCYFDFLTYPLLVWAFPLCWYLVVKKDALSAAGRCIGIIYTAVCWILGYVGMFFLKWFLLYVVCGAEAYRQCDTGHAFSLIGVVADEYKVVKQTYNRFDVLYTNWRHYLFAGFVPVIMAWLLWMLYTRLRYQWKVKKECIPFLVISLSGSAWYLVFSAHTAIHHFFTYRIYGASVLAVILFLCGCVQTKPETAAGTGKSAGKTAAALLACLCVGWALTAFAKENVTAFNGGDNQTVRIMPGDIYECGFTATFNDIREFGIIAKPEEDADGTIQVRIYDGGLLYETEFSVQEAAEKPYVTRYVEWRLKPGREYRMEVSLKDSAAGVDLLLTREGDMPFQEYQNSRLNGVPLGEIQLLGSIVYNTGVRSKRIRLYLAFLLGCYLWMGVCAVLSSGILQRLMPRAKRSGGTKEKREQLGA